MEAEVTWRKLALSTESEYVFDFDGSDQSFFYTWTEMTYAPVGWLGLGIVTQKTEAYHTAREIQRGPMVAASRGPWRLGIYRFNPDRSDDGLFVGSLGYQFQKGGPSCTRSLPCAIASSPVSSSSCPC